MRRSTMKKMNKINSFPKERCYHRGHICFIVDTYSMFGFKHHVHFVVLTFPHEKEFFFLIFLFQPSLQHMEVPRPGSEYKLQLQPTPQLQRCWILNPLGWVGIKPMLPQRQRQILNLRHHNGNSEREFF